MSCSKEYDIATIINGSQETVYVAISFNYPDTACPPASLLNKITPGNLYTFIDFKSPEEFYNRTPILQFMVYPEVLPCGTIDETFSSIRAASDSIRKYNIPPLKRYRMTLRNMAPRNYTITYPEDI